MSSEYLAPMSGDILEIDQALDQSRAKIYLASKDYRLKAIVEAVASADIFPNYQFISELLEDVEQHYGLLPIEVVDAYGLCEQKYEYAKMELIDE